MRILERGGTNPPSAGRGKERHCRGTAERAPASRDARASRHLPGKQMCRLGWDRIRGVVTLSLCLGPQIEPCKAAAAAAAPAPLCRCLAETQRHKRAVRLGTKLNSPGDRDPLILQVVHQVWDEPHHPGTAGNSFSSCRPRIRLTWHSPQNKMGRYGPAAKLPAEQRATEGNQLLAKHWLSKQHPFAQGSLSRNCKLFTDRGCPCSVPCIALS